MDENAESSWHVVWWTFLEWPPWDERGSWQSLAEFYRELCISQPTVELSTHLPESYLSRPAHPKRIVLNEQARAMINHDLFTLVRSDRIAKNMVIHAAAVCPRSVHLVISVETSLLTQKVARLKSRLATLLSFKPELGVGGQNTWGKGIWKARLHDLESIASAKEFVNQTASALDSMYIEDVYNLHQIVIEKCEKLLRIDHSEHEEIIRFLQDAADPFAIPFIKQAILLKPQLDYLAYDDYGSYYKKCFWALKAIGSKNAIELIKEFTESVDPIIKEQAHYRLSKI